MSLGSAVRLFVTAASLGALAACGGSGPDLGPTEVTTPPAPAASISAVGEGPLVLHPSADSRFAFALETPIRLRETSGGTADWNFARISYFMQGREIERYELGADVIRTSGYSRIGANHNQLYRPLFRSNSNRFDRVDITLGFGDLKDARQFTVAVPFGSFSDVNVSLTPASVPPGGSVRVDP